MQQGNVLFLILVAVALFAALSYAVTSTQRGGNDSGKGETIQLAASNIIQYGTLIQNTVLRLKMNGCDDTNISFENATISGYTNSKAPANETCHVFNPAGGGQSVVRPPAAAGTEPYIFNGSMIINNVGPTDTVGTCGGETGELIIGLPIASKELCQEINSALSNPSAPVTDWLSDEICRYIFLQ